VELGQTYFQIDRRDDGASGFVQLTLEGELDMASLEVLTGAFEPLIRERRGMLLDLSRLEFVDITGLRAIMDELAGARDAGCPLVIRGELTQQVTRVIELAGAGAQLWPV
jgi:anti-anti-sigma factor